MLTSGATLHAFSDGCCRERCCDVAPIGGAMTQRRAAKVRRAGLATRTPHAPCVPEL